MIWGYPYFRKPPYESKICHDFVSELVSCLISIWNPLDWHIWTLYLGTRRNAVWSNKTHLTWEIDSSIYIYSFQLYGGISPYHISSRYITRILGYGDADPNLVAGQTWSSRRETPKSVGRSLRRSLWDSASSSCEDLCRRSCARSP